MFRDSARGCTTAGIGPQLVPALLVKCPTGLRDRAMLEVMYRAGLRVSEVVKLKPGNIRWETGEIEVRDGKGGKDRVVPVDRETIGLAQTMGGQAPEERPVPHHAPGQAA